MAAIAHGDGDAAAAATGAVVSQVAPEAWPVVVCFLLSFFFGSKKLYA